MLRRVSPLILSAAFGLAGYFFVLPHLLANGWAMYMKATGKATQCPWGNTLTFYSSLDHFDKLYTKYRGELKVAEYDKEHNLERFNWPGGRDFWAQRITTPVRGFGWLLAEHQWMKESTPQSHVRKGDVVIDCGAHIGVFTWKALEAGASKVVAVEPDPTNLECLRRNFKKEIAEGRVVLAAVGVWSKPGKMTLNLGEGGNTGENSMVMKEGTTLDRRAGNHTRSTGEGSRARTRELHQDGYRRRRARGASRCARNPEERPARGSCSISTTAPTTRQSSRP